MPKISKRKQQMREKLIKNNQAENGKRKSDLRRQKKAIDNFRRKKIWEIVKRMLDGVDTRNDICPHFKIGSTNFKDMILGKMTMDKVHASNKYHVYDKNKMLSAKLTGSLGESATEHRFASAGINLEKQVFGELEIFPICATTDFITFDIHCGNLIEVKTTRDPKTAKDMCNSLPLEVVTQVWIQMECLNCSYATIIIELIESDPKLNPGYIEDLNNKNLERGLIKRKGVWSLKKKCSFFPKNKYQLLAKCYVEFLFYYLKFTKVDIVVEDKDFLEYKILERAENIENIYRINPIETNHISGNICKDYGAMGYKRNEKSKKTGIESYLHFAKGYNTHKGFNISEKKILLDEAKREELYAWANTRSKKERKLMIRKI